jgi:predicted RNA binding protein YcfA (HicA-like mRNA interferase family)
LLCIILREGRRWYADEACQNGQVIVEAGFVEVPKSGGHRKFVHPDGRETEGPIHAKELRKGIQATILKQAGLR